MPEVIEIHPHLGLLFLSSRARPTHMKLLPSGGRVEDQSPNSVFYLADPGGWKGQGVPMSILYGSSVRPLVDIVAGTDAHEYPPLTGLRWTESVDEVDSDGLVYEGGHEGTRRPRKHEGHPLKLRLGLLDSGDRVEQAQGHDEESEGHLEIVFRK